MFGLGVMEEVFRFSKQGVSLVDEPVQLPVGSGALPGGISRGDQEGCYKDGCDLRHGLFVLEPHAKHQNLKPEADHK